MTPITSSGLECSFAQALELCPEGGREVSSSATTLARAEPQSSRPPAPRGGRWVSLVARESRLRDTSRPPPYIANAAAQSAASPRDTRDHSTRRCRASLGALPRRSRVFVPLGDSCGGEVGGGVQSKFRERPRRPSDRPRSGRSRALGLRPSERTCVHVPSDFPRSR